MITVHTLHKATEQEVFDQVAAHLLLQNEKCTVFEDSCAYRSEDGKLACAAGCLISDEEMEYVHKWGMNTGNGWDSVIDVFASEVEFPIENRKHDGLIRKLQRIHDANIPEQWREELRDLAHDYKLKWNFPATGE